MTQHRCTKMEIVLNTDSCDWFKIENSLRCKQRSRNYPFLKALPDEWERRIYKHIKRPIEQKVEHTV